MTELDILHYATGSQMKSGVAERVIRSIKQHVIDQIVLNYNKTVHSTTKYKPIDVNSKNSDAIYEDVFADEPVTRDKSDLKIGDYMDEEGFYLSLNASASYNMYRDNTLATFKNDLHSPIDFDQEQWMVGLAEVQIDSGVINVSHADAKFSVQREMLVENLNNKRARKAIDSYLDIKAVTPKKDMFLTRNYVSIQDLKNVFADAQSSEEDEEELEAVWIKDKFSFEIDSKHYNRAEDVIQAINKALNVKRDELKNLWLISDPVLDDTQTDDSKRKLSISISTEAINE
ncbi:unnamed protein product, partial [Rotaria magnacalcarata]